MLRPKTNLPNGSYMLCLTLGLGNNVLACQIQNKGSAQLIDPLFAEQPSSFVFPGGKQSNGSLTLFYSFVLLEILREGEKVSRNPYGILERSLLISYSLLLVWELKEFVERTKGAFAQREKRNCRLEETWKQIIQYFDDQNPSLQYSFTRYVPNYSCFIDLVSWLDCWLIQI